MHFVGFSLIILIIPCTIYITVHIGPKDRRVRPAYIWGNRMRLHASLCIEFLARLHQQPFTGEGWGEKRHVGVEIQPWGWATLITEGSLRAPERISEPQQLDGMPISAVPQRRWQGLQKRGHWVFTGERQPCLAWLESQSIISWSINKRPQWTRVVVTCKHDRSRLFITYLLQPTGHVTHRQFNIQQLYALPTLYLCVLCLSENKQRLVPLTAWTDWFL
jgi:hypothetical protein